MEFNTPLGWMTQRVKILMIGAGGTGSELIQQLFKMHFCLLRLGHEGLDVTLMDGDTVSTSNVGRQSFWPCDVGRYKAETLITRFNNFGGTDWTFRNEMYNPATHYRCPFDLLITCVDSAKVRAEIGRCYSKTYLNTTLWLDGGNASHTGQVILGHLSHPKDTFHIPNVWELYPSLESIEDDQTDSCSHAEALRKQDFGINIEIASAMRNLLWQLLRHGKISHHGVYVFLKDAEQQPLKIDPLTWATYGYQNEALQQHN